MVDIINQKIISQIDALPYLVSKFRNNMKNFFLAVSISAIGLGIPMAVSAQTEMVWDDWGLGFTLVRGMQITESTGEVFSAESDDLFLSVMPVEDAWANEEDLADAVIVMMETMEFERVTDADELEFNDLYGYYIEGKSQGAGVVVMALMDVASSRNFLLSVVFTPGSRERAIQMVKTFYAYGE